MNGRTFSQNPRKREKKKPLPRPSVSLSVCPSSVGGFSMGRTENEQTIDTGTKFSIRPSSLCLAVARLWI